MVNKPKAERYEQMHITVSPKEKREWEAHKEKKFNGLPAMSMMIRNFVNDGIARENKRG